MTYLYQITGVPYQMTNGAGVVVTTAPSFATNYSLPGVLTPNGNANLATSVTYSGSFAVTSVTGPNGATGTTSYDLYGRPSATTSPDGATTNYTYTYLPNTQTATITTGNSTQWKKTTLDGFGRPIKVETGHDSTTMSEVDTQYAPCACSPLGKLSQTSVPFPHGQTPAGWTTYTYDGSGRTLTVTKPDATSTTTYLYQGNTTKVTDPAGHWKIFTNDASGNLVTVTEPDASNQPTVVTNYTYNGANQLTGVSMPRNLPSGGQYTQVRSFVWSGSDLTSTTNPENGTVTYAYDGAHHVTQRTDAKGQRTQYTYDTYGRLTLTSHYDPSNNELPGQDVNYYYDYPVLSGAQNTWGRLSAVTFSPTNNTATSSGGMSLPGQLSFTWTYGYQPQTVTLSNAAGAGSWQAVLFTQSGDPAWLSLSSSSGAFYTNTSSFNLIPNSNALAGLSDGIHTVTVIVQDDLGNLGTITVTLGVNTNSYPYSYLYSYNQAGRVIAQRLTIPYPQFTFDAAYTWDNQGRMTSQTYPGASDPLSYTYDAMGNLTTLATGAGATATYNFAGQLQTLFYQSAGSMINEYHTYDSQWPWQDRHPPIWEQPRP